MSTSTCQFFLKILHGVLSSVLSLLLYSNIQSSIQYSHNFCTVAHFSSGTNAVTVQLTSKLCSQRLINATPSDATLPSHVAPLMTSSRMKTSLAPRAFKNGSSSLSTVASPQLGTESNHLKSRPSIHTASPESVTPRVLLRTDSQPSVKNSLVNSINPSIVSTPSQIVGLSTTSTLPRCASVPTPLATQAQPLAHHPLPPQPPPHPTFHPPYTFPPQPFPFQYKHADSTSTMTAAAMAAATVSALPAAHAHPPFVPHLSYMEGQFATHALILEQQRRIKALEAELEATRSEVAQLRSNSLQSTCDASSGGIVIDGQHSNNKSAGLPNCQRPPTEDPKKGSSRYWTADEHSRFLDGLKIFGQKDIKSISRHVGTRSATQVRTHAQKYYLRIERERAKADGIATPTGPIIPRERRCNQKGRPRGRENASGGSLSAESAGGEAGTSTNNGSSCTGEGHERSRERKPQSPGVDCKFADDGVSGVDFKDIAASIVGNESLTEQDKTWKAQLERKGHISEDMETASSAKENGVTKVVKQERDDVIETGRAVEVGADICAVRRNGVSPVMMDRTKSTNETCKAKVKDEALQVSEAPVCGTQEYKGQTDVRKCEDESCKVENCETGEAKHVQSVVEICKRKSSEVEEVPRKARKRSKSNHRMAVEGAAIANGVDFDEAATVIDNVRLNIVKKDQQVNGFCEETDGVSGVRASNVMESNHTVDRHEMEDSSLRERDGPNPDAEDNQGANSNEVNVDLKTHIAAPSREPNTSLHVADAQVLTWSSQLPPRGGTERGQIIGLLESGGSATNLRSLLQLPGMDGGFGTKAMTLRRNGSSNSVLADLPKNSGFLSRSNSFLILNNGKGVTRSSSILSLLSGLPTAMRESASSDRLLGLDSGNHDVQGGVDDDCEDFGDHNVGQSRLMSTTLLGRANGTSEGSLGDRCLSFGQLHHMGVDDLEDAGAVALSLSDDAEKWSGDGECDRVRPRCV